MKAFLFSARRIRAALARSLVLLASVALLLSACGEHDAGLSDDDEAVDLRVMSFNIEWGGAKVSFEKVAEAIRLAGADVVGIQEAEGNLQRLAADLGWHYDLKNYAISRYPILSPPGADRRYVYVEVRPGRIVALANVHLPSSPFGTDLIRDGASLDEVLDIERSVRLKALTPYLAALAPVVEKNTPVFITGDFNAPAHTDWTEDMVGARPFLRYPVEWPVSRAVAAAGYRDSWREVYPDPRTHPGLTWWAARPPLKEYTPDENDPQDRIDFVWFAGTMRVLASTLVGEQHAPDVSLSVTPWPSDHRALVSTFRVRLAEVPRLASPTHRLYGGDEEVVIAYRRALNSDIDIVGPVGDSDEVVISNRVSGDGEWRIAAGALPFAHYAVRLSAQNLSSVDSDFWVIDRHAVASVDISAASFAVGEPIGIRWRNGPGNRNDYLGVYEAGVEPGYDPDYDGGLTWLYIDARPEGSVTLDASSSEVIWPLKPGRYVVRLHKDDGYDVLAESAPFEVR